MSRRWKPVFRWAAPFLLLTVVTGCGTSSATDSLPEDYPGPTSREESDQIFMDCLAERGWEVEQMPDGGFTPGEIPDEQVEEWNGATTECWEHANVRPENFSQNEWEEWYGNTIETSRCLEAEGYSLPEQPTLQEFIDGGGEWSPYVELLGSGVMSDGEFTVVQDICPEQEFWPGPR